MGLLSKLIAPVVLSVPLSAGCGSLGDLGAAGQWQFEREEQTQSLGLKEVEEKMGSEYRTYLAPVITSGNTKTEAGPVLNVQINGEKREVEVQKFRVAQILSEQPILVYKRERVFSTKPERKVELGEIRKREIGSWIKRENLSYKVLETLVLNGVELSLSSEDGLLFNGENPLSIKADETGKAAVKLSSRTKIFTLDELIKRHRLFNEFQPASAEVREALLKDGILEHSLHYSIKVSRGTFNGISLSEAVASESVECKAVSSEYLAERTARFVRDKVNSSLKTVTLTVRDIDSHIQLPRASYVLSTTSPSKDDLLKPYFSGSMLERAKAYLDHYENGERTLENGEGTATFRFAPGSTVKIEVTNPQYNFYKGEFKVTDNSKKSIEMSEKGQKVRVRIVEE